MSLFIYAIEDKINTFKMNNGHWKSKKWKKINCGSISTVTNKEMHMKYKPKSKHN